MRLSLTIKAQDWSTTLSTGGTEARVSSTGVAGAVSASDWDVG